MNDVSIKTKIAVNVPYKVKFCRNFAWFRDFGRQPRL